MLSKITVLLAFLPVALSCTPFIVFDEECIGSFAELRALETARGNNNAVPVTYTICPNTVFDLTGETEWELNGNTNYLCGFSASSASSCVVRGGDFQFSATSMPYGFSNKSNIRLYGFTFENAGIATGVIASSGNFEICDCIFKVSK
jgi:hypothetical protein